MKTAGSTLYLRDEPAWDFDGDSSKVVRLTGAFLVTWTFQTQIQVVQSLVPGAFAHRWQLITPR